MLGRVKHVLCRLLGHNSERCVAVWSRWKLLLEQGMRAQLERL